VRLRCIQDKKRIDRRLEVELGSSPVTSLGVVLDCQRCSIITALTAIPAAEDEVVSSRMSTKI